MGTLGPGRLCRDLGRGRRTRAGCVVYPQSPHAHERVVAGTGGTAGTVDDAAQAATIAREFTRQAQAFAVAPVMHSKETLDAFLDLVPVRPGQRWLDVACGPGIVSRALARRTREVVGVDLTPAMVAAATETAATEGIGNARFVQGDATALPFATGTFEGALTRFSLHHIPHPVRVLREMARVVAPGGHVAVADHQAPTEPTAAAWHYEIERLRDPSHWMCLTRGALRAMGQALGLEPVAEKTLPFTLDWEEWLTRGSGGAVHRALIAELLATPPPGSADAFRVVDGRLHVSLAIVVWRRP